jgi:hypothetical protein
MKQHLWKLDYGRVEVEGLGQQLPVEIGKDAVSEGSSS